MTNENPPDHHEPIPLRPLLLWFVAALALFWLGNWGHSVWDRDEPRYSVATREMVQTGDWIVPHFNGEIRYDKPVLIYWLMAAPTQIFGMNTFSMRAIQGVAGALTVVMLFVLAGRMGASPAARHLAAMCGVLFSLLTVVSKAATTDAWLTFFIVSAIAIHWEQWRRGFGWGRHVAFWAVLGLAALLKGPVGPAVVLMAILGQRILTLVIERRRPAPRELAAWALRPVVGLAVLFAIGMPWVLAVNDATDGEFLRVALGRHVLERSTSALEGHSGPFFYYIPVIFLASLPFCALVISAFAHHWTRRRDPASLFLWCWIIPAFIMFSAVRTKLPHYMAPLLPAQIMMIALWWTARSREATPPPIPLRRTGAIFVGVIGGVLLVGLPFGIHFQNLTIIQWPTYVVALLFGVGGIFGARLWWLGNASGAVKVWAGCHLGVLLVALLWLLPTLEPTRPSYPMAEWIRANAPQENLQVVASDYQEPSFVFYVGTQVEMVGRGDHEIWRGIQILAGEAPVAYITTRTHWDDIQRKYPWPLPEKLRSVSLGDFYLFTKGRWTEMVVLVNWDE